MAGDEVDMVLLLGVSYGFEERIEYLASCCATPWLGSCITSVTRPWSPRDRICVNGVKSDVVSSLSNST